MPPRRGPCVLRSCAKAFALRLRSRYQITKMRCPNRSHTIWTTAHLNSVTVVSLRCHLRSGRMMCRECEWSRNGSGTEKRTLPGSTLPRSTISTHLLGRCSTRGTYWLFSTFWDVLWSSNRYRLSCWLRYVKRHRSLSSTLSRQRSCQFQQSAESLLKIMDLRSSRSDWRSVVVGAQMSKEWLLTATYDCSSVGADVGRRASEPVERAA